MDEIKKTENRKRKIDPEDRPVVHGRLSQSEREPLQESRGTGSASVKLTKERTEAANARTSKSTGQEMGAGRQAEQRKILLPGQDAPKRDWREEAFYEQESDSERRRTAEEDVDEGRRRKENLQSGRKQALGMEPETKMKILGGILAVLVILLVAAIVHEFVLGGELPGKEKGSAGKQTVWMVEEEPDRAKGDAVQMLEKEWTGVEQGARLNDGGLDHGILAGPEIGSV